MGKRSNGCFTCRKRKVKCDEGRPTCERCRKATYKCGGYEQPWLSEEQLEREARRRSFVRHELDRTSQQALVSKEAVAAHGFLSADSIAQGMNLFAFREDICRSFLFHRLCAGDNFSKGIGWWLNPTPRVDVQSRTLVSASKAMTAAFFGKIHQQPRISTEAYHFYTVALHNLNNDLSHKVKAYTFETLGATMALNMYEMIHLTSEGHGLITHAGGINKLIHARGPRLHKSYPEKEIYLEARIILVANSIFACQPTFLDEPKWKDHPWEDDPSAKTQFDYLVDVLSDIPRFLNEATSANLPSTIGWHGRPRQEALQEQLLERFRALREIRKAWDIEYSHPMWEIPVASASSQGPDGIRPPFSANIYFTNMWRAYEYITFQINCMLLFMLYRDLSPDNLQPVEHILPGLFPNGSVQMLARNICRCTEFLCLERHGSRGYIILQLPATIAYLAIDKTTPEAKWLYDVCKKNAQGSGFGWGDFAMDQVTPLSQWMVSYRERHRDAAKPDLHSSSEAWPVGWPRASKQSAPPTIITPPSEEALPMRGSKKGQEVDESVRR